MIYLSMIAAMLQGPVVPSGTALSCGSDRGPRFSVYVPPNPPPEGAASDYRVTGLGPFDRPGSVFGSLADALTIVWDAEDGSQMTIDILRFDAASGTARYRLRRESEPGAPIVTVTASNGICIRQSGSDR